jgi:hypothetical protein
MVEDKNSYSVLRDIVANVRLLWHLLRVQALPWFAVPFGFWRKPDQAVSCWPYGTIPLGPRVAVFAHFDRAGAVRPYVLDYLSALSDAGFSIVFASNAGRLKPEAVTTLKPLCAAVIVRRNVGYDFGALREALVIAGLPRTDTKLLLLLNDSVYGPVRDINELILKIDFERADVWGATDSWQTRYHLQSFFIAAGQRAFTSPAWTKFWSRVKPVQSKTWIIQQYEVGLTQALLRAGMRCAAVWPYEAVLGLVDSRHLADDGREQGTPIQRARAAQLRRILRAAAAQQPLNPTADLWRQLLRAGFPFLKRELLRCNPTGVYDVADWREELQTFPGIDIAAIERDLQITLRNRAP